MAYFDQTIGVEKYKEAKHIVQAESTTATAAKDVSTCEMLMKSIIIKSCINVWVLLQNWKVL